MTSISDLIVILSLLGHYETILIHLSYSISLVFYSGFEY